MNLSIMVFMKNKNSKNLLLNKNILYKLKYFNIILFLFINLNFVKCITIKQVGIDKIFSIYDVIIEGDFIKNSNGNGNINELKNYYSFDESTSKWSSNWSYKNKSKTDKIDNTVFLYSVIKNSSIYAYGYLDINRSQDTTKELIKEVFWDTDLSFIREEKTIEIDDNIETVGAQGEIKFTDDPLYINPKYKKKEYVHVYYKTFFDKSKISTPAFIRRNYRLYNKSISNIKVRVYKAYIENEYDISLTANMINQNINISPPAPPITNNITDPSVVDGYIWKYKPFWETNIGSETIETIFYSNNDYLGPFLIKIYDTNDKLLFTDRVKYVFPKITNETKNFETKLEWKKKINTTTTILTIASVSNYNNEFYAEYPK